MKKMGFSPKMLIALSVLLLLSVLSHRIWLDPFVTLTSGDVWFIYQQSMLTVNWSTWISHLSLGSANVSYNLFILTIFWQLMSHLGLDYQAANQITYFLPIIVITPIASFFYLYRHVKSIVPACIGTIVYMFTTFFLLMQNGGLLIAVGYALIPLVFLTFEYYLTTRKISDGLLFILVLSISILYELRITYITIFVIFAYIVFYFYFFKRKNIISEIFLLLRQSTPLLIILMLLNLYIYVPLFFTAIQSSATSVLTRGLFGADFFSIKNPFVLMHPFWTGKVPSEFVPEIIPWYFWLYPFYAFSALLFFRKNKHIVFYAFVALVMVFLGKSASPPNGDIYVWLYNNFPGFGFFREPSKFWAMLSFSYSVLISYSSAYVIQTIQWFRIASIYKTVSSFAWLVPITVVALFVGKPAFTGELGDLFTPLHIPHEEIYLTNYLSSQNNFFRTLYVPGMYRLGYWSQIHPMLGINELPSSLQTLDPRVLSLLGVKYIIMPLDITNDVYRIWGDRTTYDAYIQNTKNLKKVSNKHLGNIKVYTNSLPPKPHFYPINDITYAIGNENNFIHDLDIVPSVDLHIYYQPIIRNIESGAPISLVPMNPTYEKISRNELITAECIRCIDEDYQSSLVFPFARFTSLSPFYQQSLTKEQKSLDQVKNDPKAHIKQVVFYATKRMAELQRVADLRAPEEDLLPIISAHKQYLTMLENDLHDIPAAPASNDTLLYVMDYLNIQNEVTTEYRGTRFITAVHDVFEKDYIRTNKILQEVKEKVWMSGEQADRYYLTVPNDGDYQLLIHESAAALPVSITIDHNKSISLSTTDDMPTWLTAGSMFLSKGVHEIELMRDKSNVTQKQLTITVPPHTNQTISIPLKSVEQNQEYIPRFRYQVSPGTYVKFYLNRSTDFEQLGHVSRATEEILSADDIWHTFAGKKVTARVGEKSIALQFDVQNFATTEGKIQLSDVQAVRNTSTEIVLVRPLTSTVKKNTLPQITYQWINPTKYKIHISAAKGPFVLMFSEAFHPDWKAYFAPNQHITAPIVATSDNVKEALGENNLDLLSFMNFFVKKDLIPDHMQMNGFENGWFISRAGSYDIIVEFSDQDVFTLCLFISGIIFFGTVAIIGYLKYKQYVKA